MWNNILIGAVGSIIATIAVLLTRIAFYKIRDLFPSRSLFKGIVGTDEPCYVFIQRLTDPNREGNYIARMPEYAVTSPQPQHQPYQLLPWVTSIDGIQSVSNILNTLGRTGRTKNIQIMYVDRDFDRWNAPMFIIGGSHKSDRAYQTCEPFFIYRDGAFLLQVTRESFIPRTNDHDIGLLQKMFNPSTGLPVWLAMGMRGAGTTTATYALARWWKEFGILFGNRCFGMLLEFNDQDGWQQHRIIRIYPEVRWYSKLLHPIAWKKLCGAMIGDLDTNSEQGSTEPSF